MLPFLIKTARLLLEVFAQASIPFLLRSVAQAIRAGRLLEFHQLARFQSLDSLPELREFRPFLLHHLLGVRRSAHQVIHFFMRHLFRLMNPRFHF